MVSSLLQLDVAIAVFGVFPEPKGRTAPSWLLAALVFGTIIVLVTLAWYLLTRNSADSFRRRATAFLIVFVGVTISSLAGVGMYRRGPFDQRDPARMISGEDAGHSADWFTDRGRFTRTGVATEEELGPTTGRVIWRHRRADEAFYGSPAWDGQFVYAVGSTDDRARFYAFEPDSGQIAWAVSPTGHRATFSSPVIHGGRLYCGEGLHHTTHARLVCLDLSTESPGELLWSITTESHVEATPTIVANRIYFGAGDDGVYALETSANTSSAPSIVFHAPPANCPDAESAVAVVGQRLYAGLGVGGQALVALDTRDGRELGRLRFAYPVLGIPSVAEDKLFVGMGQGDYLTPNAQPVGQVVGVALDPFRVAWTFPLTGSVLGAVAVSEQELIWGCSNGTLYVADFEGRERARLELGAPLVASPAVTRERIYLVTFDGELIACSRQPLRRLWSLRLGGPGRYSSSPIVARGRIFVGTPDAGFVCVGEEESP